MDFVSDDCFLPRWYYFAREPKGELVEQIPDGYDIRESVNGIISFAGQHRLQDARQRREGASTISENSSE